MAYVICIYTHACVHNQLFQLYLTIFNHMDCSPPLFRGFSWREHWSGLPVPPPGYLPNPAIKPTFPVSPGLQADSLPLHHLESHIYAYFWFLHVIYYINIFIYWYICIYILYVLTRYLLVEFVSFYLAKLIIARGFLNSHLWWGSLRFYIRKQVICSYKRSNFFFSPHCMACMTFFVYFWDFLFDLLCATINESFSNFFATKFQIIWYFKSDILYLLCLIILRVVIFLSVPTIYYSLQQHGIHLSWFTYSSSSGGTFRLFPRSD